MLKGLEDALAKVLRLPEDKQEVAAELLEQLACGSDPYLCPTRSARSFATR